jgi:hypothetical protein
MYLSITVTVCGSTLITSPVKPTVEAQITRFPSGYGCKKAMITGTAPSATCATPTRSAGPIGPGNGEESWA